MRRRVGPIETKGMMCRLIQKQQQQQNNSSFNNENNNQQLWNFKFDRPRFSPLKGLGYYITPKCDLDL